MEGFFKQQVVDLQKKIQERNGTSVKVPRPPKGPKAPKETRKKSLTERILSKTQDGNCTGCTYGKKARKEGVPPPPGLKFDDQYIWANKSEPFVGNKSANLVILVEQLDKKAEYLQKYLEATHSLTLEHYCMIPSLLCLPIESGAKQNESKAPFIACGVVHTEKMIKEVSPKYILTIGKSLFAITKQDEPNRVKTYYTKIYSSTYDCWVLPCPDINYMLEKIEDKYFFQDNWYRHIVDQHILKIKENSLEKYEKRELINTIAKDFEEVKKILITLIRNPAKEIVYDIETSGFIWKDVDTISGISLCVDEITSYYLPWRFFTDELKGYLSTLLTKKRTIAQNGKFDEKFLTYNGITVQTNEDTMLMHHMLHAELPKGLKTFAYIYTQYGGYDLVKDEYMTENKIEKFSEVPEEILGVYACMDTRVTFLCYKKFRKEIEANEKFLWLYENISIPLAQTFRKMEMRGMLIDRDYLDSYSTEKKNELKEAEEECFRVLGYKINLSSPKDLTEVVTKLKYPVEKRTPKNAISVDAEAVDGWAKKNLPFAVALQKWTSIETQITSFIGDVSVRTNGVYQHIRSDGRVHCDFNVTGTETGRVSSSNPNLQNQPKDKAYRRIYICPPGYTFIEADFSQAELRVAAVLSDDAAMKEAFRLGHDIHCTTVAKMIKRPYEEVVKRKNEGDPEISKLRKKAKSVNFGVVYGETAFSLAEDLGVSVQEAEKFLEEYFRGFSGLGRWREKTQQFTAENACTYTYWGRKRSFPELSYRPGLSKSKFGGFMRQAMNTPVQGSSSDYVLYSLIAVDKMLEDGGYKTGVIATVHDSIVFEAALDEVEILRPKIKEIMENIADIGVKMEIDIETSKIWGFKE